MPNYQSKRKKKKKFTSRGKRWTKQGRKSFSFSRWFFKWTVVSGVWLGVAVCLMFAYYAHDLPDISKLHDDIRTPTVKVLAGDESVIASFGNMYGNYVAYEEFPSYLIDAVLSTEDRRFFSHFGLDPIGLLRAAYTNYKAGRIVQGGSTITQQLAKVVFLSPERTLKRKVQEVMLAFYLESIFSKEEILATYLNRIYTGAGNYGMDAAAQAYFGKHVSQVNLYEAAMLAGLIQAPSRYAPSRNRELAQQRADQVLFNMVDNNKLSTKHLLKESLDAQIFAVALPPSQQTGQYFADWIKEQLPDYSGGFGSGDLTVVTTLDVRLQALAEKALHDVLAESGQQHKVSQGAMVVMSPQGEVLAMVGGKSYKESQFNRATQAYRQPGSAFKLFVYLTALESGYTPEDTVIDEPVTMAGWTPGNWDDRYVGEVSLRNALSKSINTVAVKIAQELGIKKVTNTAYKLGITSQINNDLSSALGTSEMTLLELTGAYAHMANYGESVWVYGIRSIKDTAGTVLYERSDASTTRVISAGAVAAMNDMLRNVIEHGTGSRARLDRQAAGKTGTSQNARDAWFIGYTPDYVVGVWLGNDDNSPMQKVAGGGLPALVWKNFMEQAHQNVSKKELPVTEYSVRMGGDRDDSIWAGILESFGGGRENSAKPLIEYRYPNSRN